MDTNYFSINDTRSISVFRNSTFWLLTSQHAEVVTLPARRLVDTSTLPKR